METLFAGDAIRRLEKMRDASVVERFNGIMIYSARIVRFKVNPQK